MLKNFYRNILFYKSLFLVEKMLLTIKAKKKNIHKKFVALSVLFAITYLNKKIWVRY